MALPVSQLVERASDAETMMSSSLWPGLNLGVKKKPRRTFHYDHFIMFQHCVFLRHPLPTLTAPRQDEYVDSYNNKHSYLHSIRVFCVTLLNMNILPINA